MNKKTGILNDQPLSDFVAKVFASKNYVIHKKLAVSCVDVNSGSYVVFDETTTDIVKAIISSASLPFIFPNQKWPGGVVCMDGGTVWNTNLASAVERCKEQVDNDS